MQDVNMLQLYSQMANTK